MIWLGFLTFVVLTLSCLRQTGVNKSRLIAHAVALLWQPYLLPDLTLIMQTAISLQKTLTMIWLGVLPYVILTLNPLQQTIVNMSRLIAHAAMLTVRTLIVTGSHAEHAKHSFLLHVHQAYLSKKCLGYIKHEENTDSCTVLYCTSVLFSLFHGPGWLCTPVTKTSFDMVSWGFSEQFALASSLGHSAKNHLYPEVKTAKSVFCGVSLTVL